MRGIKVESGAKRICFSCGAQAPLTETDYTLISSKYAWRCKKTTVDGEVLPKLTWYCPSCWKFIRAEAGK